MKLVYQLDELYSLYIRNRDKRCVTCGTTDDLTNGHLRSRASYSTRWDDRNCHAQCKGCNLLHEHDPSKFDEFFIGKFGLEAWHENNRKYRTPRQFKSWELAEMIAKYRELTGEA